MNKTIYKYNTVEKGFTQKFTIQMPKGAELLSIQIDGKTFAPTIWALVDPNQELEERYFELFGTGHDIPCDMGVERKYVGTYQYQKGEFVGHVFERIN